MRSTPFVTKHGHRWLIAIGLLAALMPGARADDAVSGTWEGSYRCGQGNTALVLDLRPGQMPGAVDGLFYFHESTDNPGVPEGCFAMSGSVDRQRHQVTLSAGRWLLHPFGYVTVDLVGQLDPGGERLSGRVIGPLCDAFELRRVESSATTVAPACLGNATVAAAGAVP